MPDGAGGQAVPELLRLPRAPDAAPGRVGGWFFTAASASWFGLGVIFLPFAVRAKPAKKLIGDFSKPLLVLSADAILFANMMNMMSCAPGARFTTEPRTRSGI